MSGINELQLKLKEHDVKLEQVERLMSESIGEQRSLTRELHELTSNFKVYIERHDQVSESNKRIWQQTEKNSEAIHQLQKLNEGNQPVIDGIKTINSKLVWLVISAMASPIAVGGYILVKLAKSGGGL